MNKRLHSFFKVILLMALLHTGLDMSGQTAYDKLYWNGYNPLDIESINLDGTRRTMLYPSSNAAFSLEVDVPNQKMYWCDLNNDVIMKSNLDGTNASVFLANVIDAQGISMDFTNHVLYFTSTATSTIEKVNLDGTGRTVVVGPSNAGQPESLKVDSSHQKLYWFDHNAYSIKRCNMDGTGVEAFVSNSGNALQLDIDETNSKLYWPNWGMNILESINLDGTSRTTILSGFVNVGWPLALTVDKVNNKIYWWDADMYYIKRVNTDGTGFEVFLNDIYSVAAMIIPLAQPTSISSNPSAATICAGGTTTFSITASNATGYQWQVNSGSGFTDISNGGAYSGATTATLTITEATSEMNGSSYRCIASANSFPDATSESASLTVSENITYYEDFDGDGYGNGNGSVTTDSCTGAPEGFVSNFSDCDDNDPTTYPGAVEICDDGADNNCDGNVDECDLAIITHPAHEVTICLGEDASFSVTAFGMPFYRWQVNDGFGYTDINDGELYTGAFTATLIINTPSMEMNGYVYRCIVYGNDDTATSDPGELFIKTEMVFTGQPYSAQWCLGEVATYTCFATSATNYQWQVNEGAGFIDLEDEDVSEGGHYSDVHTRELSIYNLNTAMEGFTYRCIASNECAADATSNYAALTILDSENAVYYEDADGDGYGNPDSSISHCYLPGGYVLNADDCNDYDSTVYPGAEEICGDGIDNNCDGNDEACPIVYHPQRTTTICLGENATLWITANSGLTYQWQLFNGLGYTDIDNGGIYSGTDTAALLITNPSEEINGQAYRCAISGIEDGIPFESFTDPGVVYVRSEMIMMAQPQSYEACPQEEVRFYSYATSGASFQWQVNDGSGFTNLENGDAPSGGSYTGVDTSEMYVNNLTLGMSGYTYRCIISNECFPDVTSDAAELIVIQSQDNIVYYEDIDGDGYGNPDTAFAYCYLLEDMEGYVFNGDDCNDYDSTVYPGAEEICGDGIDNDCDGNTDEDCEFCQTTSVWNGSDWFPTGPSIESKVVFMADYTSTDILPACSVEVMDNVTVTIASGHTLAVWTKVEVHPLGQLIFNNNASLIQHPEITVNENTGSITFHKDSNELYNLDYTLWSSPTSGTQTLKDFSTGTLDANFFVYNTALSAYSNYLSQSGIFGSNPNAVTFTSGKGYLVRMPAGLPAEATSVFNGVFEGTPNNGDVSIALSNQGGRFNAVGNPYPSPISIRDFIDANEEQMDNGTLYFWRKTNLAPTATYVTVTNMGSAAVDQPTDSSGSFTGDPSDWVIQPGQGFLFKASTTASELIFNNFMRRPSTIGPFFRPAVTTMDDTNELSRIWLDITNSGASFGQAVIGYSANTTNGLDFGWDGRLYNDSDLSIYTKSDDAKLAIQARASFTENDAVPLSYKANNAGMLTLKMSNYDGLFAGNQQVYLKDNVFNIYHDLKAGDYTFSTEAGTFEDRFEVVYQNVALGTDNPVFDTNNVIIYKDGSTLKIDAGKVTMKQVDIFDIRGRLLYSASDVNATTLAIGDLAVAQQVLIVQITSEDNSRTSKKIIY